jgi:uncharacterized membrane protein
LLNFIPGKDCSPTVGDTAAYLDDKGKAMKTQDSLIEKIDQQDWLEDLSRSTQKTIQKATHKRGTTANSLKRTLHGNMFGYPIHPIINDIPIGAWTVSTVMDGMGMVTGRHSYDRGSNAAAAVGIAGAVTAAMTGWADWSYTAGHVRRIGMFHALLNTVTMLIFGASLMTGQNRGIRRTLRLLGLTTLGISGYLGNHIAYRKGVVSRYAPPLESPEEMTPALAER